MATLAASNSTSWSSTISSSTIPTTAIPTSVAQPTSNHSNRAPKMIPHLHRQQSASSSSSSNPNNNSPNNNNVSVDLGYHQTPYSSRTANQTSFNPQPQPQQQQQQQAWAPSPTAPPFYPQYPSYFQPNPHMSVHPHGYYDQQQHQATAAQQQQQHFAQWAYQQMIFNAQQQQLAAAAAATNDYHQQRNRTPSIGSHRNSPQLSPQPDFYPQHHPFPPTAAQQLPNNPPPNQQSSNQYQGFHPYRRPGAARNHSSNRSTSTTSSNYYQENLLTKQQNSGSSSGESNRGTSPSDVGYTRPRTNSSRSSENNNSPVAHVGQGHSRTDSSSTATASTSRPSGTRSGSVSSTSSSTRATSPSVSSVNNSPTSTQPTIATQRRPAKPSPLSQGSTTPTNAEDRASRRMSRDDSDLNYSTAGLSGVSTHVSRTGGLKGRLRRALTLNANGTMGSNAEDHDLTGLPSKPRFASSKSTPSLAKPNELSGDSSSPPHTPTSPGEPLPSSNPSTGRAKSKSLFNMKFNASTDNISLSSTVSSASVMIRKIGNMGKIARRSSIAGITKLFKDKKKKGDTHDDDGDASETEPTSGITIKAARAQASVSHATAEFDRGSFGGDDMRGLSPAARLARQHTLKSKAAEAIKAQQALAIQQREREQDQRAEANVDVPATWERGTAKRNGQSCRPPIVTENGTQVFIEDDDEVGSGDSDSEGDEDVTLTREGQWHRDPRVMVNDHFDEDEDDDVGDGDEDMTIRMGSLDLQTPHGITQPAAASSEQWEPWRTPQRNAKPTKGILRNAANFDQNAYLEVLLNSNNPIPPQNRVRSNSYSVADHSDGNTPGAMARIPSPDPDHIDGLHKTDHHRASLDDSRLPDFSFEFNSSPLFAGADDSPPTPPHHMDRSIFNHPGMNSSAPVLSTLNANPTPPPITRATPTRRIAFAANLSIYDTFSATIYDRRCEPVTCNRLTPALAQRIKEELNTYKMEEMEVHSASRNHTHFFV